MDSGLLGRIVSLSPFASGGRGYTGMMVLISECARWESKDALHGHWEKPWLVTIRETFDKEDLIVGGETIKDVKVIGGFADRKLLE